MCLLSGSLIHAQNNGFFDSDKLIRERLHKQKSSFFSLVHPTPLIRIETKGIPFQIKAPEITLANGNRLRFLAEDHMPCIIPAPATAGLIPNAGNATQTSSAFPAAIPNPGRKKTTGY